MKFIGIFGIIALLGLGFLLSTNRRAIKPRIIFWGLSLQLLFATIILGKSFLSWSGMFVFILLILVYLFENEILRKSSWRQVIAPSVLLLFASAGVIVVAYFLESIGVATYLFWIVFVGYIVFLLLKKTKLVRYFFSALILIGHGIVISRGVFGKSIFAKLATGVTNFLSLTDLGSEFLFGNLIKTEHFFPGSEYWPGFGYQFAFSVLPTIIFFSAIMSILYYFGVMQAIVKMMAKFMRWTMGTSGAETLSCSANIFIGQTEAPLLIKPFLDDMTLSELHAIMVGGFATIAGGVLAGYIRMGIDAGHLIAASVMAAPAALVMAKIMLPETEHSKTAGDVDIPDVNRADNILDAASRGVTDGLKLAVNVGAMLLAFIALIGVVDGALGIVDKLVDFKLLGGSIIEATGEYRGIFPGSMKTFFGTIFRPVAFLMGVPWSESLLVGNLLGIKIAVNEFVGYAELGKLIANGELSERAATIATYALCGFANFSSIGIQIGGIGAIAPKRRTELSRVAVRAMFAGAFVSWISASIAGMLL